MTLMTPRIQDFPFANYVRDAGLAHLVQSRSFASGGRIGAIYLDPAWLQTEQWFPITNDAATAHDFFGIFHPLATQALYEPEVFSELAARAHELTAEPDYDRAFALGSNKNYWHFMIDFVPRLVFIFENGDPSLPLLVNPDFNATHQSVVEHIYSAQGLPQPRIIKLPERIAPIRRAIFPGRPSPQSAADFWNRFLPPLRGAAPRPPFVCAPRCRKATAAIK